MAVLRYAGVRVTVDGNTIRCRDPEMQEVLELWAEFKTAEGYHVNREAEIVAILEAEGAEVVRPTRAPKTVEGRVY